MSSYLAFLVMVFITAFVYNLLKDILGNDTYRKFGYEVVETNRPNRK